MRKQSFLFLLFLGFSLKLLSQGFIWNVYAQKDGIKDLGTISEITQDNKGYLWFVNETRLTRFDGAKFQTYFDASRPNEVFSISDLQVSLNGDILFNTSTALGKLEPSTGIFTYFFSDSIFTYLYFPKYEAYKFYNCYLDKDLYRVFSKDKTKEESKLSDTLYYQYFKDVKYLLLPKQFKRERESVKQDHYKNIYITLKDTLQKETVCFQFEKGTLNKLFTTKLSEIEIIRDKSGLYWCFGENRIQCFSKEKLLKEYQLSHNELEEFGSPLIDSKGNIWISVYYGLIRVNLNEINFLNDKNRHVTEYLESQYDPNGNEQRVYKKSYRNFYTSFAIDKYNNIVTGERLWDGYRFSNISTNQSFKSAFDNVKKDKLPYLYTCFVDNENNIWYGTNSGLVKASPFPLKELENKLSFEESDYKLVVSDHKGRKYFEKADLSTGLIYVKIYDGDSLIDTKEIKPAKNFLEVTYRPCFNGILYKYQSKPTEISLNYYEPGGTTANHLVKNESYAFSFLCRSKDSAFFYTNAGLILFAQGHFTKIKNPLGERLKRNIPFSNSSRIILSDFTEIKLKQDLNIDSSNFLGLKGKEFATDWYIDYSNPNEILFKCKNGDYLLITKMKEVLKLKNCIPDSIQKELPKLGWIETSFFKDVIIFSSFKGKKKYFLFEVNRSKKQVTFVRNISFADGLIDVYYNHFYYVDGYVAHFNENKTGMKFYKYEDFILGDLSKGYEFENHYVFLDGVTKLTNYNETFISDHISYLGRKGINLQKPLLNINSLAFVSSGVLNEFTPDYKKEIEIPYNSTFIIDFKAICLTDGKKVKYRYKLVGLDDDWQPEQDYNSNSVKYQTLSEGSYTFQVIACNNNGIWNEKPAEIKFTVLPPWNRTWWAYTMYVLAGFGAVRGYLRNRTKKLQKEKQKLEKTVEERTAEVVAQKHLIEEKNKEITDSINYAQKIQHTLLASKQLLDANLKDYFVLFKPKDIVSGDFYWAHASNEGFILVTADCTGHGVPGAFMSLLSISYLNEITKEQNVTAPDKVFNILRDKIIRNFDSGSSEHERKDGMDAVICKYDFQINKIQFACANNPVWIMRNGELIEFKPDKMPVGRSAVEPRPFSLNEFDLKKGDIVYTLTDGYADQFGGPRGKKFMYKPMKDMIISFGSLSMEEQKTRLDHAINEWKGKTEQVDDILLIGIRI